MSVRVCESEKANECQLNAWKSARDRGRPGEGGGTYLGDMEMRGGVEGGMRGDYLGRGER